MGYGKRRLSRRCPPSEAGGNDRVPMAVHHDEKREPGFQIGEQLRIKRQVIIIPLYHRDRKAAGRLKNSLCLKHV